MFLLFEHYGPWLEKNRARDAGGASCSALPHLILLLIGMGLSTVHKSFLISRMCLYERARTSQSAVIHSKCTSGQTTAPQQNLQEEDSNTCVTNIKDISLKLDNSCIILQLQINQWLELHYEDPYGSPHTIIL